MTEEYTILSAYATEDPAAVVIQTREFGDVMVHKPDRPELWKKLMDWVEAGGKIAPRNPRLAPDVD